MIDKTEQTRRLTNRARVLAYLQAHGRARNWQLVQVGGMRHCGVCGSVVVRRRFDKRWAWSLCSKECQSTWHSWVMTKDRAARFWAKVDKGQSNECWLWRGRIKADGYGEFSWTRGRPVPAHRAAFCLTHNLEMFNDRSVQICHLCDVRHCVNPSHLWKGNALENVRDMHAKGRATVLRGERHNMAKLDENKVRAILRDHRKPDVVARDYGVSGSTIRLIIKREIWKCVEASQ